VLDSNPFLFTITDLKQYIFCPRILYYHTCLPDVRPVTYKMEAGIQVHEMEHKRSVRRSMKITEIERGDRMFDVALQSQTLGLSGQIDEIIHIGDRYIPVDYKLARKAGYHFKVQVAAYAMLVESTFQTRVEQAILYLTLSKLSVDVRITDGLRREVYKAIETMRDIAAREAIPPPTEYRQRCIDCEFRRFCNDVI
jgi:CRISPR-associated exonuclease Cas4